MLLIIAFFFDLLPNFALYYCHFIVTKNQYRLRNERESGSFNKINASYSAIQGNTTFTDSGAKAVNASDEAMLEPLPDVTTEALSHENDSQANSIPS